VRIPRGSAPFNRWFWVPLIQVCDTYLEGNKVPGNTYRTKKLIRVVALKLKKFHACPNYCILYRGKYENLQSCPHCGASRYKKNAGCHVDDEEGPTRGAKKKMAKKQPPPEDNKEEGYTEEKSCPVGVVPTHHRLVVCTIWELRGCQAHFLHASAERTKDDGKL
jgi:hypothetical protein